MAPSHAYRVPYAHSLTQLFEPDLKRYCWIKSDPTFQGMRQILYEPEERVFIGETAPNKHVDANVISPSKSRPEEVIHGLSQQRYLLVKGWSQSSASEALANRGLIPLSSRFVYM